MKQGRPGDTEIIGILLVSRSPRLLFPLVPAYHFSEHNQERLRGLFVPVKLPANGNEASRMSVLLSVQGLTKSYGPRPLFADLALDLRVGERVGLIGPNGAGKSTLLKILASREDADSGNRSLRRSARLGYLAQDDTFPPGLSVRDVLLAALANEPLEDYERETQVAITLTQVGFDNPDQQASILSGGWSKRLSLARELVRRPDLLLLDEPTNHLDLPGIVWLERLLRDASFSYLVATHDRAFLRAVADEVIEISRVYPAGYFRVAGGYDDFNDRRESFLEAQAKQMESVANQVRRENEWLGRKAAAQTRKASSRVEDAARRREELGELKYRTNSAGAAGIDFVSTGRQTRKLLTAKNISKSLGGENSPRRLLFSNLDLMLTPGVKLGLLGANGSGKSTLLRVLAGLIPSDTGTIARAEGLRAIMFEQGRVNLDQTTTLKRALCSNGDTVMYRERPMHVAAWAKKFLFAADQLDLEISALSGGEQARVRIAQLMLQPADLLLLDEPTNDLDIPALEVLEESLAEFPGAVILVSHDRDLMDRICTEVVGLDGVGGAPMFASLDQWLAAHERAAIEAAKPAKEEPKPAAKLKKLSFKDQQELDGMEAVILAAEETVTKRQATVEKAATASHLILSDACKSLEEAQHAVERLYARWQELEAKRGN